MAKNKKKDGSKVGTSAIREVWRQIDAQEWMALLKQAYPNSGWSYGRNVIKGRCPFHQDKDPSFAVDLVRGQAKCYGADCGTYFWDPVRFYRAIHGNTMSYHKALMEMKDRYSIRVAHAKIAEIGRRHKHREMKKLLLEVMRGELIDCAAMRNSPTPNQDLFYARDALAYCEARGVKDVFHLMPIGVMPPSLRLEQLLNQRVAFMNAEERKNFKDVAKEAIDYLDWAAKDTAWLGALVFFTGATVNDVARLKLRRVPRRTATEWEKQKFEKDVRFIPDQYEHGPGIFGLHGVTPYFPFIGDEKNAISFVYVEGEFDAACIWARQFANNGQINAYVFAGGGGGTEGVDVMKSFGFHTCYVVGDYDKGGKDFVEKVLEQTIHVGVRVFKWPDNMIVDGQGSPLAKTDPAEQVCFHGLDRVQRELRREDNYQMAYLWAINEASKQMSGIDPNDIRHLTNVAARMGRYVRNDAEQHAYVSALSKQFNVAGGQILIEMKTGDENDAAFIERFRAALGARLLPLDTFRDNHSHVLRVWDKEREDVYDLYLEEKTRIRSTIAAMTGKDILQYVEEDVGRPSFLEVDTDDKMSYIAVANKCAEYLSFAVTRLSGTLETITSGRQKLSTGFHKLKLDDRSFCYYLVNGTKLYKGQVSEQDDVVWSACEGPRDERVLVALDHDQRPRLIHPQIKDVPQLNAEAEFSFTGLHDLIWDMIDEGWDLKNQAVSVDLLAAFVMLIPIANVAKRQPLIMLTAENTSGKTEFIGGFVGSKANRDINVVQNAEYMDNFTQAGVRQRTNNASLCLCLDEFEYTEGGRDRKNQRIADVLGLLRCLANDQATTTMGSASGKATEWILRFPVLVAGIRGLVKPEDLSRFLVLEMDRKPGRRSPQDALLARFGEEVIERVRCELPVVAYRNAYRVQRAHDEIVHAASGADRELYGDMTSRTRNLLSGPLAAMKVAGRDYRRFIRSFLAANKTHIHRVAVASQSRTLLEDVLHTPCIRKPGAEYDSQPYSIATLLQADDRERVNVAGVGCYHDGDTGWLVVHWPAARHSVLAKASEFRMASSGELRSQAKRSEHAVADRDVLGAGVLERAAVQLGPVAHTEVTVFRLDSIAAKAMDSNVKPSVKKGREEMEGVCFIDDPKYADLKRAIQAKEFPKPPRRKAVNDDPEIDDDGDDDGFGF